MNKETTYKEVVENLKLGDTIQIKTSSNNQIYFTYPKIFNKIKGIFCYNVEEHLSMFLKLSNDKKDNNSFSIRFSEEEFLNKTRKIEYIKIILTEKFLGI